MSSSEAGEPSEADATRALRAMAGGDAASREELTQLLYRELRAQADRYLRQERGNHTLQPTALVNEAWMRLIDQTRVNYKNRGHFLGVASRTMRRVLVDHARAKKRDKRGGGAQQVELDSNVPSADGDPVDLVALDDALDRLHEHSPRLARIVELRFFGGLSMEEVAGVLEVSLTTVEREWRTARAWLRVNLRED